MEPSKYSRDRYSRQTVFPGIGEDGQQKLGSGFAVIIGCGALGCTSATLLVRAGIGKVRVIDRDFVEYHNLHRQVLFNEEDVRSRLPKAIAAERHLKNANSTVIVEGIVADINYSNIERFCQGANVILDGLDNLETRFLINDVALKHKIPWVYGGAIGSNGMTMTVIPEQTPCLRCIFPVMPEPGSLPTCETVGVINAAPSVIAALQATEAIKLLVGSTDINHKLTIVDVWGLTFERLTIQRRQDCPSCSGTYEYLNSKFEMKISSFCGQSRALQIVNTKVDNIALNRLATRLAKFGNISINDFMLTAIIDTHEIVVFPDGRVIIKNTLDEELAKELYQKYIVNLI